MSRTILVLTSITFIALVAVGRPTTSVAASSYSADVSVVVTDDTPSGHPDTITTIDIPNGEPLGLVRTVTPLGGTVAAAKDIPDDTFVGWISGFSTIPKPDGSCGQRFDFDADLTTAPVDPSLMPSWLDDADPGPHIIRFEADVAGTPVNMIFDHVQIKGETRLVISTYIGSPTTPPPPPPCGHFRTRTTINGMVGPTPVITTSPIASEPQVQEFTLTTRPDSSGHLGAEVAERTVKLVVQPALQPRIEGDGARLERPARRRLLPRGRRRGLLGALRRYPTADLPRGASAVRYHPGAIRHEHGVSVAPDPTLEPASVDAEVFAYDSDNVLLARQEVVWVRDRHTCWYAPGTEPLLSVEPASGACDGEVTIRGSRFPNDVRVEIENHTPRR